jgi:thiamine-monophosphate kinase
MADEKGLIKKIERAFRRQRKNGVDLSLGDDASLWQPRRAFETILTCDWFLEGTHFLRHKHPADAVGWKCLARAVSDVAAMGGEPRCFLLSLALPPMMTGKWMDGFLSGLRRASRKLRCELAGGDTTNRNEVLISISVIGELKRGHAALRSGAHAGDAVFVSGILGEADLGLRQLRPHEQKTKQLNRALRKHLYPEPRLELGQWIVEKRLATAMMDISDGLSTDLPRMCEASGVGAQIEVDSLPVSQLADRRNARQLALHGGDDYELLFTVRKKDAERVPGKFHGLHLTRIGEITRERGILIVENGKSSALVSAGWDPFRNATKR